MKFNIAPLPAQYAYACGTYIATFDAMSIGDENNKQVALVVIDNEEWAKHLKLLAAAPAMLAALQAAKHYIDREDVLQDVFAAIEMAGYVP